MQLKRTACTVLCCVLIIGSILAPVGAAEKDHVRFTISEDSFVTPLATGSFNMAVAPHSTVAADSSFSLAVGETVTIRAYYTPTSASVDFGLVDSAGTFYYFNTTNGNIDKTMRISKNDRYTLRIRNNSGSAIQVSGFVNY